MTEAPTSIRPPKQERSRASFERVLAAAQTLLEEEGYEAFTLAAVSKKSGVSTGSIYARVASKDALFDAVHERVMREILETHTALSEEQRWEGLPAADLIMQAVAALAEPFHAYRRFLRVLMHRGAVDERVAQRGSAASSNQGDIFKGLILRRRDEITHRDPELAADIAYRMVYCTIARQVMYGPTFESRRAVAWDDLLRELGDAVVSYLLGPRRRA